MARRKQLNPKSDRPVNNPTVRTVRTVRNMQPLDRAAATAIGLLCVVIVLMLLLGSQALPQVRTFSWQDKAVSAEDIAFLMEFTQPVDPKSVEKNLQIEPALPGKFSWAGRKMAYTVAVPAPYGEKYELSLSNVTALNGQPGFKPFDVAFETRDRIFAYIGVVAEERGRLVLYNMTTQQKTLLSDAEQRVMDFQPYPERDRILYSSAKTTDETAAMSELYSVSTGLGKVADVPRWQFWRSRQPTPAGTTQKLLGSEKYQNLKFDLSPDGKVIVVQRINREKASDSGPWIVAEGKAPRKLETGPSGDFRIAPDSLSLLLQQGQGTSVIDLDEAAPTPDAPDSSSKLLDFLPDYGLALDVASDGSAAALVNFNQDDPEKQYTQSLFWVSNRGEEKQLLQTDGGVISAQFSDDNQVLYCLLNRLVPGEAYQVVPYLTAVNVKTGKESELLELPPQPEVTVSLAPDGLAILFDEALVSDPNVENLKETIERPTHRLWLMPLFGNLEERLNREPIALPPTDLEISGRHPEWLP